MPENRQIVEWRGVEGLVAAEVICDDNQDGAGHGYVTGEVFNIAGVAKVSRATDTSTATHYYDNIPAVVVSNNSSDTVTVEASALPLDVFANLTGQQYDSTTGALIEGERKLRYFAMGYITKKTNGDLVYVWRLKGSFAVPDQESSTEDDGTDANGNQLVYTGIQTTHKFTKCVDDNGNTHGAKALNVDTGLGLADVSAFFDTVTTPDTLTQKAYELTITSAQGVTVSVTKGGEAVADGADIFIGDELVISVTGGTLKVNGTAFTSGQTYTVAGDTVVEGIAGA